jgi:hypothetical protein
LKGRNAQCYARQLKKLAVTHGLPQADLLQSAGLYCIMQEQIDHIIVENRRDSFASATTPGYLPCMGNYDSKESDIMHRKLL